MLSCQGQGQGRDRAGQGRTRQNRAGQDKAGQDRTGRVRRDKGPNLTAPQGDPLRGVLAGVNPEEVDPHQCLEL